MQDNTLEISTATLRNWSRIGTENNSNKLKNRANKRLSEKRFIPEEYATHTTVIEKAYYYLDLGYSIEEIIYSIVINLTKGVENTFLISELKDWAIPKKRIIKELSLMVIEGSGDVLGGIYQSLLTEGEKNKKGSYYTPDYVVIKQIGSYFIDGQTFLDPCCGTGQYLINVPSSDPKNIWGADLDKIAVKIARINIMIKYPDENFSPNIFHADSLAREDGFFNKTVLQDGFFDVIATNPPRGSKIDTLYSGYSIKSGESFSYFIEKGLRLLKKGGILSYILPESILNVKTHEDIRSVILRYNILSIHELGRIFSGVFTPSN